MEIFLLIVALTVIVVSLPAYSTVITTTDGAIFCDGITCPKGSTTCIVSKRTFGDLKLYKYIRLCTDAYGVPTHTVEEELPNPLPGTVINSISSIGGGNRPLTEEERKELDATINKVVQDTNEMIQNQNNYWTQWTKNFNDKMQNMFPPGFPFN